MRNQNLDQSPKKRKLLVHQHPPSPSPPFISVVVTTHLYPKIYTQ